MDFSQPSNDIVTKKTEAENEKLNQIRNNVSILEAEVKRLRGLVEAEKYAVEQLVLQKKELEQSIPQLMSQYNEIGEDIVICTSSLESLKEQKIEMKKELEESEKIAADNKNLYTDQLFDMEKETALLDAEREIVNERAKELNEAEQTLNKKLAQLKDIIA